MKTIPLEDFLKKHDLQITIMQRQRSANSNHWLRIYRMNYHATLRSRDGETFHFAYGNFVEGDGDTKIEAFDELMNALNRNTKHEKQPIYSTGLDRFATAVRTIACSELLDGSKLRVELI